MPVTVRHGVNTLTLDHLAGRSVRQVREEVSDLLNVPDQAQARINGASASEDHVVADGTNLEFVKVAGEKGAGRAFHAA